MKKFIYLIKETECIKTLSPLQMQDYLQKWINWTEKLTVSHSIIFGESVEPAGKQIKGIDKLVYEAGDSWENSAVIGIFLVNALNWDEAIAIAKRCPVFEMNGEMEVKIVRDIN